jgi:sugar lactone lactonase YvrE
MNYLIVTTARSGMTAEDSLKYPESGNVFIVETNVKGLPLHRPNL